MIAYLRLNELLQSYMLFMLNAMKKCRVIDEFCEKSIVSGPLDEMTWERLRSSIEYCW